MVPNFGPEITTISPDGADSQRATDYLSATVELRKALLEDVNTVNRLGNACSKQIICSVDQILELSDEIKTSYESIRNLDPPQCLQELHASNLEYMREIYVAADFLLSSSEGGYPVGYGIGNFDQVL